MILIRSSDNDAGDCPPARDTAGMDSNAPRWSSDVHQADWIGPRLAPWDGDTAAIVVPAGFAAYARVLHPAESQSTGTARSAGPR